MMMDSGKGFDKNNDNLTGETKKPDELLFLGTFYHDDTVDECQCDLIQFKGPVHISEIRIIPLGAKVKLSNGTYQLGATNPSKLELEFFFNNLTEPENSTFGLIQRFDFDDKSRIHLKCDDKKVITDGIIVRGLYSTISLGLYGVHVDHVEIASPKKPSPVKKEIDEPPIVLSPAVPLEVENDVGKKLDDSESPLDELESEPEVKIPIEHQPEEPMETDIPPQQYSTVNGQPLQPQAIPTILTSRSNFSPMGIHNEREPPVSNEIVMDTEEYSNVKVNTTSPVPISSSPSLAIIETEDISDGEVPSTDEDQENKETKPAVHRSTESLISSGPKSPFVNSSESEPPAIGIDRQENGPTIPVIPSSTPALISPQHDQLSEQDDLIDDYQEPGIEEILSDEEMSEFIECDYGEWEEYWSRKFNRTFNPFSENFVIAPLQNFSLDCEYLKDTMSKKTPPHESALEKLLIITEKFSIQNFSSQSVESWVSSTEILIPLIPVAVAGLPEGDKKDKITDVLLFWAKMGTDLEFASTQTNVAFKVRHVKLGIRLIHTLTIIGGSTVNKLLKYQFFSEDPNQSKNVQEILLDILTKDCTGISTQLLIVRALDGTINSKLGYEKFVMQTDTNGKTCFQRLIEFSMNSNLSSRISYSLRSFLNKLRVMESIETMHGLVSQLITRKISFESPQYVEEFMNHLQFLLNIASNVGQTLAHPIRMFPVGALMEMPSNSFGLSPKSLFIKALEESKFMKICAVLLCWKDVPIEIITMISDLINTLLVWEIGLVYFCNEGESSLIVIKALMLWEEEGSTSVGVFAAHCVETLKCLDVITEAGKSTQNLDDEEDIPTWQALYSFLSTAVARKALIHTLSLGDNIMTLFKCIKPSEAEPSYLKMSRLERSARKGYAVEIISIVVKNTDSVSFLKQYGHSLHKMITALSEEGDGCDKLNELLPFLKLSLNPKHFTFDGIESLCETIRAKVLNLFQSTSIEDNWGISPELITAVRILAALGVPSYDDDITVTLKAKDNEFYVKELKYTMSLVKMHSLDCVTSFVKIINRIAEEFSQPAAHSHLLVGSRGDALVNLLLPVIKLLRSLLTLIIQTRKTEFRDVTAIPALIQIHALLGNFPTSSLSFAKSQEISQHIISILLAYTIPALKVGEETEEELNKSAWTALISEALKFTLSTPNTFVAGLNIISELLPLPLPMAAKCPLDEAECSLGIKMRRLWSAYLHYLSPQIQEMIGILCGSTYGRLICVLKRVCLQLADLSAATCLVVVRAILDAIITSIENDYEQQAIDENCDPSSSVKAWVETANGRPPIICSAYSARLLGFLASLVANAPVIKGGLMQAIRGTSKIDEKYSEFLSLLSTIITSSKSNPNTSTSHVQAQDNVVTIFQSLCDVENNILVPVFGKIDKFIEPDVILANSLPQRDHLNLICSSLMSYLDSLEDRITTNGHVVEGVIRALEILSDTEYGFYHLRTALGKFPKALYNLTNVLTKSDMENPDMGETLWPCITSFLELLRSLTTPRNESTSSLPPRQTVLKPEEMAKCIGWNEPSSSKLSLVVPDEPMDTSNSDDIKTIKTESNIQNDTVQELDTTKSSSMKTDIKVEETQSVSHPLIKLKLLLEKYMHNNDGDEQPGSLLNLSNYEPVEFIQICENVISVVEEQKPEVDSLSVPPAEPTEVLIRLPDLLADVYSQRTVFVLLDNVSLESLPSFWLTSIPPSFDLEIEQQESDLTPCDLTELVRSFLSGDVDIGKDVENLYKLTPLKEDDKKITSKPANKLHEDPLKNSLLGMPPRKMPFNSSIRGGPNRGGFGRPNVFDPFRSRPPNTSRPPSLHVDDFVAMESGQTGGGGSGAYKGSGMRGPNEQFTRNRGNMRGSPRPYASGGNSGDRSRPFVRSSPPVNHYYPPQRNETMSPRGRYANTPPRGRGYDRWSSESRGGSSSSSYNRQEHMSRSTNYEDKFRPGPSPGGSNSNRSSSGVSSRQPYSRNSYSTSGRTTGNGRYSTKSRSFQR